MKEKWILWEFQELGNIKKKKLVLKNTIAKIKNAPERIHDRLDDA